jgi:hypothetical protein
MKKQSILEINDVLEVGTFVRYELREGSTGGRILSIKGANANVQNWVGSAMEIPLKDLEYVKSWNDWPFVEEG